MHAATDTVSTGLAPSASGETGDVDVTLPWATYRRLAHGAEPDHEPGPGVSPVDSGPDDTPPGIPHEPLDPSGGAGS